jgi:hypothetical protein
MATSEEGFSVLEQTRLLSKFEGAFSMYRNDTEVPDI